MDVPRAINHVLSSSEGATVACLRSLVLLKHFLFSSSQKEDLSLITICFRVVCSVKMDSEAVLKINREEDRRISLSLTFRASSMSVTSLSHILDFPMTLRALSVLEGSRTGTLHEAIRAHDYDLLQVLIV